MVRSRPPGSLLYGVEAGPPAPSCSARAFVDSACL
jgi:hypothetical protein